MLSICFSSHENKRSVGWRKKCVTFPVLACKGRVTLHKKKNTSDFQTNLILNFWIFFTSWCRDIFILGTEKNTITISDKWSHVSFAGFKSPLHSARECICKAGKQIPATVLWLELFLGGRGPWHSWLWHDPVYSFISYYFPPKSVSLLWDFCTVGNVPPFILLFRSPLIPHFLPLSQ